MTSLSVVMFSAMSNSPDDTAPHPRQNPPSASGTHDVEVLPAASHHFPVEAHQEADLLGAAPPVLGGERVDGEVLDPDLDGSAGDVDEHRLAHLVPLGAAQAALSGPSAIAVHHHGDVLGQLVGGDGNGTAFEVCWAGAAATARRGRQLRNTTGQLDTSGNVG